MTISNETLLELYRNLLTARRLGEKLFDMYYEGGSGMPWVHSGIGEEAIPIAVCANLKKDDFLKLTFRTDFCLFAKGLPMRDVIAAECYRDVSEIYGHRNPWFLAEYGLLGHTGALGEDVPIYLGSAVSAMFQKTDKVCVCIIGDGSANRGPVHEAMALAAAWDLPIIFGIQNNKYGMGTAVEKSYKLGDISDRAKAYGFPGVTVDGNDIIAVYEVMKEYVDRARSGGGPGLVVFDTYRVMAHVSGDKEVYRPDGEAKDWWKYDPLPRYQKSLMDTGILKEEDVAKLEEEIKAELEKAVEAAMALPTASYENHIKSAIDEL